jgi:DNA-binding GntR family transcriptional regulator
MNAKRKPLRAGAAERKPRQVATPADTLEAALESLEDDIVFGRLHPRERLVEDALMARFAIKRHVVRDVLARLEALGLVERKKNVGALVRSFTRQQIVELYAMRELLETQAARLIELPVDAQGVQDLIEVQREHDAAVQADDLHRVFRSNQRFHQLLFALAPNRVLVQAIEEYSRRTHPIRFLSLVSGIYREQARQDHWRIIEALQRGDRKALVKLCATHLAPSRDTYLKAHRLSA